MLPARLFCITLVLGLCLSAAALAQPAESGPYTHYPALYEQAKAALGGADAPAAAKAVNAALAELAVSKWDRQTPEKIAELLAMLAVLTEFNKGGDAAMRAWLLDHPAQASRLLYAIDGQDSTAKALDVLVTLRDARPDDFEDCFEFCAAFAVVWDDYRGHWWIKEPMESGTMLANYQHFHEHRARLMQDPRGLPHELGVFVVGSRLRASERDWIVQQYGRKHPRSATQVYASVPWTQVLSPAHGKGLNMEYTLPKIQEAGGVCMEQAYFCESVYRTLGVPAVYTRGEGARGGHAWTGVLVNRPKPHFDFSSGRYTYDRYYRGAMADPTAPRQDLNEGIIQLVAAFVGKGERAMNQSWAWVHFACWLNANDWPLEGDKPDTDALMLAMCDEAIDANPYLAQAWQRLAVMANEGKLDQQAIFDRAEKLFKLTLADAPDFLVDRLPMFLEHVDDKQRKAKIYDNLFKALGQRRADLAAMVKVWEGDLWVEQGDAEQAAKSYLYPIASFPKEDHVLQTAKQRLEALPGKVDEQELEQAYKSIVKGLAKLGDRMEPEQAMAFNLALDGLAKIYDGRGDGKMADRMRDARRKVPEQDLDPRGR